MYCSKCGQEIHSEAMICPFCGCATNNFSNSTTANNSLYSTDYLRIHEFSAKASTIKTLGIFAAIFMFGFGIIFSIIIWVKTSNMKVPKVHTTNPNELAELADAQRKVDLGERLACLPLIPVILLLLFVCISWILAIFAVSAL